MNIKYILGLFVLILMSVNTGAQTYIQYTYDLNGNRQTRQVLVMQLKSAKVNFPITDTTDLEEEELSDIDEELGIRVYPNPVRESVTVEFSGTLTDNPSDAKLYDLNGSLLVDIKSKDQFLELDLTTLKDGIYILIITSDDNTSIHKIIKGQGR